MPGLGRGGAGVRNADRVKPQVGSIAQGVIDALFGQKPHHDRLINPDVAQQVFEVGRVEVPGEVYGSTISSPDGATASSTLASYEPFAMKNFDSLQSRLRSRQSAVGFSMTV